MSKFRPCIDLHGGRVKQIVGGTLRDDGSAPLENYVSPHPASWFSATFRDAGLTGGHVIQLGPGNEGAAREALGAWPGGWQLGGGVHAGNARGWLDAGASHVIVTSSLFDSGGRFVPEALAGLVKAVGARRIVIDLSCRRTADGWVVAMNRWQTLTDLRITHATLDRLAASCDEFLIHAADVEGLCGGVDVALIELLGRWGKCPVTYAGGAAGMADVRRVAEAGGGRVDLTVGSALDVFGGRGVTLQELIAWNRRETAG